MVDGLESELSAKSEWTALESWDRPNVRSTMENRRHDNAGINFRTLVKPETKEVAFLDEFNASPGNVAGKLLFLIGALAGKGIKESFELYQNWMRGREIRSEAAARRAGGIQPQPEKLPDLETWNPVMPYETQGGSVLIVNEAGNGWIALYDGGDLDEIRNGGNGGGPVYIRPAAGGSDEDNWANRLIAWAAGQVATEEGKKVVVGVLLSVMGVAGKIGRDKVERITNAMQELLLENVGRSRDDGNIQTIEILPDPQTWDPVQPYLTRAGSLLIVGKYGTAWAALSDGGDVRNMSANRTNPPMTTADADDVEVFVDRIIAWASNRKGSESGRLQVAVMLMTINQIEYAIGYEQLNRLMSNLQPIVEEGNHSELQSLISRRADIQQAIPGILEIPQILSGNDIKQIQDHARDYAGMNEQAIREVNTNSEASVYVPARVTSPDGTVNTAILEVKAGQFVYSVNQHNIRSLRNSTVPATDERLLVYKFNVGDWKIDLSSSDLVLYGIMPLRIRQTDPGGYSGLPGWFQRN